ncbi:MAG: glutamate 5-kinase [Bacteroidales bacterium]|nr:glutamate 5-kinase [Bacteroidales bacterium]
MRLVVKFGTNVLTRQDGSLDITRVSSLVDQVVQLKRLGHEIIVVSSGAVACGRTELGLHTNLDKVEQRQLYSAVGQVRLMDLYYRLFRDYGVAIGQVLTVKGDFETEVECENMKACMEVMLRHGVVPIVNENDTVSVTELMFTDNDELSGLVCRLLEAQMLIILSNIDGIYDGNPSNPNARVIGKISSGEDVSNFIQEGKSSFGRGGMASKYKIARQTAAEGIRVVIANGRREDILANIILNPESVVHTEISK